MNDENQLTKHASSPIRVLVVGVTGGTGLAIVQRLLQEGHEVTAFSRQASTIFETRDQLRIIDGDVMVPAEVECAVQSQDAVIVVLGISENPVRVRLFGSKHTPDDVRSKGTRNIIDAMRKSEVNRLVVQSSYGAGETRRLLGFTTQILFSLPLKPQIDDTEVREANAGP